MKVMEKREKKSLVTFNLIYFSNSLTLSQRTVVVEVERKKKYLKKGRGRMSYRYNGWRNNGCNWGLLSTDTLVCCNKSGMGNVYIHMRAGGTHHVSLYTTPRILFYISCAQWRLVTPPPSSHRMYEHLLNGGKCTKAGSSHCMQSAKCFPFLSLNTTVCLLCLLYAITTPSLSPIVKVFPTNNSETNNLRWYSILLARDRVDASPHKTVSS